MSLPADVLIDAFEERGEGEPCESSCSCGSPCTEVVGRHDEHLCNACAVPLPVIYMSSYTMGVVSPRVEHADKDAGVLFDVDESLEPGVFVVTGYDNDEQAIAMNERLVQLYEGGE